jgi:hypothetical protein
MSTRAYVEGINTMVNISQQTDDSLCAYYAINNLIQLSPFILNKSLITTEMLDRGCEQAHGKFSYVQHYLSLPFTFILGKKKVAAKDEPCYPLPVQKFLGEYGYTEAAIASALAVNRPDLRCAVFQDYEGQVFDYFDQRNLGYAVGYLQLVEIGKNLHFITLVPRTSNSDKHLSYVVADSQSQTLRVISTKYDLNQFFDTNYSRVLGGNVRVYLNISTLQQRRLSSVTSQLNF